MKLKITLLVETGEDNHDARAASVADTFHTEVKRELIPGDWNDRRQWKSVDLIGLEVMEMNSRGEDGRG